MLSLYISENTWLHRLPAGWKLVGLAIATSVLLPTQSPAVLMISTFIGCIGFLSLGTPGRRSLINLLRTAGLLAALIGLFQFVIFCEALGTEEATLIATTSALRLFTLVLLADLASVTTQLREILAVLKRLLRPFKPLGVNADWLSLVVGLMIRSASLLRHHFETTGDAYQARASKPAGIRIAAPLIRQAANANRVLADALASRRLRSNIKLPLTKHN